MKIYKVCLVVKDYHQYYGIDYDEIFSPVTMLKSISIILKIVAYLDYEVCQIDVKIAFLNIELKEATDESKVCKLQRSIYG